MAEYIYDGEVFTEEDVIEAAQAKNLSVDDYVSEYNIEVKAEQGEVQQEQQKAVINFDDTLPQTEMFDVDQREKRVKDILTRKYGGLGFKIEEAVAGSDYVKIIAPNDVEQEFKVDLDLFGYSTYSDKLYGVSSKTQAQAINDFIANNLGTKVNKTAYSQAWNYANKREIEFLDENNKPKKIADLSAEELTLHAQRAYQEIMTSSNIGGADKIIKEINESLIPFSKSLVVDLQAKYDMSDNDQYEKALEEYNKLIEEEHNRLFSENKELKNIQDSVFSALASRFGKIIESKARYEAEEAALPPWVVKYLSRDTFRQMYVTGAIKLPKAFNEISVLHDGIQLDSYQKQLKYLKTLDPKAAYVDPKTGPELTAEDLGVTGVESKKTSSYTNEKAIANLEFKIGNLTKTIITDMADTEYYQKKLEAIRAPSAFGKDITDPDLTLDEWQGMLGDQVIQMATALLTAGGSTYVQEGGGAGLEIIEITAAKKHAGLTKDASAEEIKKARAEFAKLKFKDRRDKMSKVLELGEVDLSKAVAVGVANAGLDLASNIVFVAKGIKFIPKNWIRKFTSGKLKQFMKQGYEDIGKDVLITTFTEFVTESLQEGSSIYGVEAATGYTAGKTANLKRIADAGAQALLTTGPITVGGKVATTTVKEVRAEFSTLIDPNSTRLAVKRKKRTYDEMFKNGQITQDKKEELYTELEAQEDFVNNTKYKKLNAEEKEKVLNNLVIIKQNQKEISKINEQKQKDGVATFEGDKELESSSDQDIQTELLNFEIQQAQKSNQKELFKLAYLEHGVRLAEHINNTNEGPMADKQVITFETKKEAQEWLNKNPEYKEDMQGVMSGADNGVNLGDIAIMVNENIKKNIELGDWSSSNTVHHEVFHFITDIMPTETLKDLRLKLDKQLKASKDPKIIEVMKLHAEKMALYTSDRKGSNIDEYNREYFTVLSDVFAAFEAQDLTLQQGVDLGMVGKIFGAVFQKFTKSGFDFGQFEHGNTLEFIKKFNKFNGTKYRKLKLPTIKGKTDAQPERKTASKSKSVLQNILDAEYEGNVKKYGREAIAVNEKGEAISPEDLTKSKLGQDIGGMVEDITKRLFDPIPEKGGLTRLEYKNALLGLASSILNPPATSKELFDPTKQNLDKFLSQRLYKRANKLATDLGVSQQFTENIDNIQPPTDPDTDTDKKTEVKKAKGRKLKPLTDVLINTDGPMSILAVRRGIEKLIKEDPANIEQKLADLIEKEFAKEIKSQMGKISQDTKTKEVTISDEYKAFLDFAYKPFMDGISVDLMKNNYKGSKSFIDFTKIGKEDKITRVEDKPTNKKDSYFRKDIFSIITNRAKFIKFFTEGKYTTLLSKQKGIAKILAEAYAAKEVDNIIIDNSNNIEKITKAKLRQFVHAATIAKQKGEYKSFDTVSYSKKLISEALFAKKLLEQNINPFDSNGKVLPKYKNKISKAAGNFVFNDLLKSDYNNISLIQTIDDINFLAKAFNKLIEAGKRGTMYEQHLMDLQIAMEKRYGKEVIDVVARKPSESDGKPDLIIRLFDQLVNIEAKMMNAQYSSVTNAIDPKTGKFVIKKQYSDEMMSVLNALQEDVQPGIQRAKDFLKEEHGYTWDNIKVIPTKYHNILKETIDPKTEKSYFNGLSSTRDFDLAFVAEIYNNKKYPVHYIQMMGRGLFAMGENIYGLNVPQLAGIGEITLRVGSNSQYRVVTEKDVKDGLVTSIYTDGTNVKKKGEKKTKRQVKTGDKIYSYRSIPTIPKAALANLQSNHSVGTIGGLDALINSKEVQALKTVGEGNARTKFAKAVSKSKTVNQNRGITVLDFDDTLATTKSLVRYTAPDGTTGTLNAEEFANTYQSLLEQDYVFDFSEFNKVVKGKIAPLFQKALKLQGKFGPENMFVLTARPPQAQQAIFDFLKANGLNIPLDNITGLGNSTAEAKALWIADKVGEGYNDFYFADDALQNVQAVKNMLDQFDVKSKVQQAKASFSKSLPGRFNLILQDVTGIEAEKRFSAIKARKRGASKGKFRLFIPPSHEDFVGLLYNFMGKGKEGDAHREFFEQSLIRPLNRGYRELDAAKQAIANDYKSLNKQFKDVRKKLTKKTSDGDFTFQDAIRVYLWDKHGYEIPGLSETDQAMLVAVVLSDPDLKSYAETLNTISRQERYVDPQQGWEGGNIKIDLIDATGRVGREQYFTEFFENVELIFSDQNLNKIEAAYGTSFRSALEDMLHRIRTGINRPKGQSATVNMFMNYLNGSVGSVMFFNMRSAVLQQMSIVNYINFADNNVFAAAKAFANQKQYWTDFAFIFNSDMLKQRRGGIQTDINGAELAQTVARSKNPTQALIAKLLQLGFLPTQIADNIAIATGGATFYRNRINKYIKDGLSKKEAESKAFTDLQDITQSTQQSARPDMTSKQQAMWIGKLILNFQNVTSQYNRLMKKAALDLINRRTTPPNSNLFQSDLSNVSRILYYGAIQNVVFYSLQTALFAMMFGLEDEDDEKLQEKILSKKERIINGTIDSILRGSGIYGAAISTLKNMAIAYEEQREKGYNKDESAVIMEFLNFSPVVGIKARKLVQAEKTLNYNTKVIKEMETFDINNPIWSAYTNYIEGITNVPVNRLYNKTINVRDALDNQYNAFHRVLMFSGYSKWNLGLTDKEIEKIKEDIKTNKKQIDRTKTRKKIERKRIR